MMLILMFSLLSRVFVQRSWMEMKVRCIEEVLAGPALALLSNWPAADHVSCLLVASVVGETGRATCKILPSQNEVAH